MFVVTGCGRFVKDPEVKEFGDGKRLAKFTLACNRNFKKGDTYEERPVYLDCVAWMGIVQVIEKWSKGDLIFFTGELEQESWTSKEGDKRSKLVLKIDSVKGLVTKDRVKRDDEPSSDQQDDDDVPF